MNWIISGEGFEVIDVERVANVAKAWHIRESESDIQILSVVLQDFEGVCPFCWKLA